MADVVGKRISELANNASIDGTAIFPHTQNGSTMRVSLSNITAYILAQVDEDTVKDAVNEWMTDHPDVTTTVQDGAISTVKLANDAVTSEKIKNGTIAGIDLSRDLLNAICASGSASGSVATFHDGAYGLPLKSCIVSVNPVQSGNGDPSPTNIRPITGWDGAEITRFGANILNPALCADRTASGITTALQSDGGIKLTGTAASNVRYFTPNGKELFLKAGTYYASSMLQVRPQNDGGIKTGTFSILSDQWCTLSFEAVIGQEYDTVVYPYIRITSGDYEPYNGTVYPVTWSEAGTVYGGTLDVTNGTLTVTMAMVDLGTLNWSRYAVTTNIPVFYPSADITNMKPSAGRSAKCSVYRCMSWTSLNNRVDKTVEIHPTIARPYIADSAYTDVATFKAAMSGVQLVYELATPVTYQLTPTEITTLMGENNIWADCGDVSVEYFAKTQTYIEQRINATKSIIAGVEAGFVATKNYAIGDLMIVGDTLYIATAAIANGGTITPGTNVTATTVADNLGGSLPSAVGVSF